MSIIRPPAAVRARRPRRTTWKAIKGPVKLFNEGGDE